MLALFRDDKNIDESSPAKRTYVQSRLSSYVWSETGIIKRKPHREIYFPTESSMECIEECS